MPLDSAPLALDDLPVLLAGPILRRVTRTSVSVWAALRLGDDVTLQVRRAGSAGPPVSTTSTPTRVGENLWLVVLTAPGPDAGELTAGASYEYRLTSPAWPAARSPDWASSTFSYGTPLPTFSAPPAGLADLRVAHTSCRKPHGEGRDALAVLDAMLADLADPRPPPQLLVLTGDQIYADDVAAPLVPRLTRVATDLVGLDEAASFGGLPRIQGRLAPTTGFGLTSGAATNHLWTLGEFLAMYLLSWSDALWPAALPVWADVDPAVDLPPDTGLHAEAWDDLVDRLETFRGALPAVRRVLANVPTLMVFDDHEVTDDWNLDHAWAAAVYPNAQGRRIVVNGLLAYALCQLWGDAPDRFSAVGSPEANLLAAATWAATSPDTPSTRTLLGVPDAVPAAPTAMRDLGDASAVRYDVRLGPADGWPIDIVLLDERTARGFPDADRPAARIAAANLPHQLPDRPAGAPAVPLLLVAPAPVLGMHLVEHWLQPAADLLPGGREDYDVEGWRAFGPGFEVLLDRMAQWDQVVVLSGDIHYGYTKTVVYERPPGTEAFRGVQLVASASKNADSLTVALHTFGDLTQRLGIVRTRTYDGWDALDPAPLAAPPPDGTVLPYDDVVDVLLGRAFRAADADPAVLPREVAQAYGLPAPDWRYTVAHVDDERLPTVPADLAAVTAVAGLGPRAGWDPARSLQVVRGLAASDRTRIGRVFQGLPQVARVSFAVGPLTVTSESALAAGGSDDAPGAGRMTARTVVTLP